MIKRREKTKREHLHLSVEIVEKRYQARDFSGQLLAEYSSNAIRSTRYRYIIFIYLVLYNIFCKKLLCCLFVQY